MISVFINGLGRIGRMVVRQIIERNDDAVQIVGFNSLTHAKMISYLLQYDSVHGSFKQPITYGDDWIKIGDNIIPYSQCPSLKDININGAQIILECTGVFKKKEQVAPYISKGAQYVVISAPSPDADATVVFGVNEQSLTKDHKIISNASCTTNCLAPVLKSLQDINIQQGHMTTVHSYTLDQNILDSKHQDMRRSRAAALNMIPTSTGASKAIGLVLPNLSGKITGMSIRVPTPNVSLIDLTLFFEHNQSKDKILELLNQYTHNHPSVMALNTHPIVSSDMNGNTHSTIVDTPTIDTHDNMMHLLSWYDNETGFSSRMIDVAKYLMKL